jgi:hypothetical protein
VYLLVTVCSLKMHGELRLKFVVLYTGHTQKNGAVSIVFTIETVPFFCVCPVFSSLYFLQQTERQKLLDQNAAGNPGVQPHSDISENNTALFLISETY